tara:strand:- start:709 stop:939 length:231 start_codon:yes stop_codon:yes gene_type:complete
MVRKECCRSCAHCISSETGTVFSCRLRQIAIHSEIATFVFCHHWTKKSPILPNLDEKDVPIDRQLDFDRALASREM